MKNQIEELTDFESVIQNDPVEPLQKTKKNVFILNKSKCECEGLKETKSSHWLLKETDGRTSLLPLSSFFVPPG